jgi:ATP/maltotriose-dependent transcriptional regulator MalT/two-component SAPR family response regulator
MAIPVTRTKINLPSRRSDLLSRPRLLEILYNLLDYRLIILAAPAGYGKTSLLIDFAHQDDLPVCWYSLDIYDRDPLRFITYFIAAVSQRFPQFGSRSSSLLEASNQANLDLDALVSTIVNEVYDHVNEHFVFVLDDFHLVNENDEIVDFVNRFIQLVGENFHLILSSRSLLTLPDMPLMVARMQVGGLSFEELAFQAAEIQALASQNYHVFMPDEAAEELVRETEGWVTGLLLSAQSLWQGMVDRLRVARVSGVGLYDYLAQQVLDQQPPPVRDFLLRTSFLEDLSVDLCRAVLGTESDWSSLIDHLLQNNLFVLPVDEEGGWIRYHHLFRDFLQSRFSLERPEEKVEVLHRLASVYAERGEWEKAHAACQRLNDPDALVVLVEQAGRPLIKSGRLVTLAKWIDALPAELVSRHPNLLSLRGVAAMTQRRVDQALELLDRAEAGHRTAGNTAGLATTLARRSVAHRFLGKNQAALEDARQALALAGDDSGLYVVRAEALRATGLSLFQMGRLEEAIDWLSRSLEAFSAVDDPQSVAMLRMELGLANASAGRYNQARTYYAQAFEYLREAGNFAGQANVLNNLGVLQSTIGDYEQATKALEEALACARQVGYARMEAYILASIGDVYADLQAYEAALEASQKAGEIAERINYQFIRYYASLAQALYLHRLGDAAAAWERIESARHLADENESSFEMAAWHLNAGRLSLADGRSFRAQAHFTQAAADFETGGQQVDAARAQLFLAVANLQAGDRSAAFNSLDRAFKLVAELDSQHILAVSAFEAGDLARQLLLSASGQGDLGHQAARLLEKVIRFEKAIPSLRRRLRPHTTAVPFAPTRLTIRALGRAQVDLDGKPASASEWQNQKRVRELFFYLLAHPAGLTKEAIGLVFWPEKSPAELKLAFKNATYKLRTALGQDVLPFEDDRYWFNRDLDYDYDVERFLKEIERAEAAGSLSDKIAAYQAAVGLYNGEYLPEAEGTWVIPFREQLWIKYSSALLALSRLHLEAGETATALEYLQRLLAEDDCLEEAYRLSMMAYASRGDRPGVTRQFERCRQSLLDTHGIQPSRQTIELYETLMK